MKKILLAVSMMALFCTPVFAEWQVDFEDTYTNKGIDQAVIDALKEGVDPDSIVVRGLDLEGLNPQNLVMALYCAGVKGQDIRDAAENHDISEMIVTAGYKKSVVECSDVVADSHAYTPVASGFSGGKRAGGGGSKTVSVSGFSVTL